MGATNYSFKLSLLQGAKKIQGHFTEICVQKKILFLKLAFLKNENFLQ